MDKLPEVGQPVQYVGHEGIPMAAVVIMTLGTYSPERDPSGQFAPADVSSVSLKITRPISGRPYVRHNVPALDSEAYADLVEAVNAYEANKNADLPEGVTQDDLDESAESAGDAPAPRPVLRFWRPVS